MGWRDPDLIHPVWITVEVLDNSSDNYDENAREYVGTKRYAAPLDVEAQVSWGRSASPQPYNGGQGGVTQSATGYLVFRAQDLEDLSLTLKAGDRVNIPKHGGVVTSVYIKGEQPAGHYPDAGTTLVVYDLTDKPLERREV